MKSRGRISGLTVGGIALLWLAVGLQAQPAQPESLVEAFVSAWNKHDAKAFGEMFSEEADWVTASGTRVKGRADGESCLGKEHLTWARTTTMAASDIEARAIGQDLAVVLFRWKIVGAGQAGTTASPTYEGSTLFVGTKQGSRWTIVAGQASNAAMVR
jgi:uncharacterized protein (TIGR02246 family)